MASASPKYTMEQFNIAVGITREYGVSLPTVTKLYEHFVGKYSSYSDKQLYDEVRKVLGNSKELSKLEEKLGIENTPSNLEKMADEVGSSIRELTEIINETAEAIKKNTERQKYARSLLGT